MNKKTIIIIASVVVVVIIAIVVAIIVSRQNEFHYEGWIDCMPPLSESEADLCRRAEAANYPYIAY